MKIHDLKLDHVYRDSKLGNLLYLGKWKEEYIPQKHEEIIKGAKGKHTFLIMNSRYKMLTFLSHKEIETELSNPLGH